MPAGQAKSLGAFYTPPELAEILVEWGVRQASDRVLDPSCGGYVFLDLAMKRLYRLGASERQARRLAWGIDCDPAVHQVGLTRGLPPEHLYPADFFDISSRDLPTFAANLGNPPYVRYQGWDAEASQAHARAEAAGVKLTRLASSWAPFIVHGTSFLAPGGRMGQVLPAELLHAQYAQPILGFLRQSFQAVTIVLFEEKVFPEVLEEVVLLFADGYSFGPAEGIGLVSVKDAQALRLSQIDGRGQGYLDESMPLLSLLDARTQELYRHLTADARVRRLGDIAAVDIGVVTGNNRFFVRSAAEITARKWDKKLFRSIISKASDVSGAKLTKVDIAALEARGRATRLLVTAGATRSAIASIQDLLSTGETEKVDKTYKTSRRSPWWGVPLPKIGVPDLFLTYMNDAFPRLAHNEAGALSTNTVHMVAVKESLSAPALAVGFYNSLTLLSAELVGRSYGGGTLKLEPTEAEALLIPPIDRALATQLDETDALVRARDLQGLLSVIDPLVLTGLVSDKELALLRRARERLLRRRRARG